MLTDGRTDGRMDGRTDARTDGRTDDGRKVITIAHPEQSSGELKRNREERGTGMKVKKQKKLDVSI